MYNWEVKGNYITSESMLINSIYWDKWLLRKSFNRAFLIHIQLKEVTNLVFKCLPQWY